MHGNSNQKENSDVFLEKLQQLECGIVLKPNYNALNFPDGNVIDVDMFNEQYLEEGLHRLVSVGNNTYRFISIGGSTAAEKILNRIENKMRMTGTIAVPNTARSANVSIRSLTNDQIELLETIFGHNLNLKDATEVSLKTHHPVVKQPKKSFKVSDLETCFEVTPDDKNLWYVVPRGSIYYDGDDIEHRRPKLEVYDISECFHFNFIDINDIMDELETYIEGMKNKEANEARKLRLKHVPEKKDFLDTSELSQRHPDSVKIEFLKEVLERHNSKIKFTKRDSNAQAIDRRRK